VSFMEETIDRVWEKAQYVNSENERLGFRKDVCGAWIKRDQYGNRKNPWGWEIDHIIPEARKGSDVPINLRPLQWQNNVARSDDRLTCAVTAQGTRNVAVGISALASLLSR